MLNRVASRSVLRIQGEDSLKFLQGLVTNDVTMVEPTGGSQYTCFLNAKGRVMADAHLTNAMETPLGSLLLDVHESSTKTIMQHLKRYIMRRKVVVDVLPDAQVWSVPESSESILQSLRGSSSLLDLPINTDSRSKCFGWRFLSSSEFNASNIAKKVDHTGIEYDYARIILGALEGSELVDRIPAEINIDLLSGICFQKGCYLGQELTARTQFKGMVRKRVMPFILPSSVESAPEVVTSVLKTCCPSSASEIKPNTAVEAGMSVIHKDTKKVVGKVLATCDGYGLGLAQMRLSNFLTNEEERFKLQLEDKSTSLFPYYPSWWPKLDASTGKPFS